MGAAPENKGDTTANDRVHSVEHDLMVAQIVLTTTPRSIEIEECLRGFIRGQFPTLVHKHKDEITGGISYNYAMGPADDIVFAVEYCCGALGGHTEESSVVNVECKFDAVQDCFWVRVVCN